MRTLTPKELYDRLLAEYGPQNWWPGEGFEIAIGAILTQNTSWTNVETALANLRENNLLKPKAILACNSEHLKKWIRPAGYFNQKAQYLRNLCSLWLKNSNPTRDQLLAVKGIGAETADSILLYLLGEAEFVIDAYTVRISTRLGFGTSQKKSFWKHYYEKALKKDVQLFNEFHALFVVHAKEVCLKNNPKCHICVLRIFCQYKKEKESTKKLP